MQVCVGCHCDRKKEDFSSSQWKKRPFGRCRQCLAVHTPQRCSPPVTHCSTVDSSADDVIYSGIIASAKKSLEYEFNKSVTSDSVTVSQSDLAIASSSSTALLQSENAFQPTFLESPSNESSTNYQGDDGSDGDHTIGIDACGGYNDDHMIARTLSNSSCLSSPTTADDTERDFSSDDDESSHHAAQHSPTSVYLEYGNLRSSELPHSPPSTPIRTRDDNDSDNDNDALESDQYHEYKSVGLLRQWMDSITGWCSSWMSFRSSISEATSDTNVVCKTERITGVKRSLALSCALSDELQYSTESSVITSEGSCVKRARASE